MYYEKISDQGELFDDDHYVEVRVSNLRHARNAHLFIGGLGGIIFTIAVEYVALWALNMV